MRSGWAWSELRAWSRKAVEEAFGGRLEDHFAEFGPPVAAGHLCGHVLRDLDLAVSLIAAVVGAVKVPVSLKMRLGWDEKSLNAPEIAKRAEAAGVRMLTVHGRTRSQFLRGVADWSAIAPVVT